MSGPIKKEYIVNGVFMGGGIKGIAHIGALKRISEENIKFYGLAGSSAGAIVASLISAGYSPDELYHIFMNTNFGDILKIPRFRKYSRLLINNGLIRGNKFYKWIYDLLKSKGIESFSDVHGKFNKDLKILTSNITSKELKVFDQESTPNERVADAVRASVAIPFIICPKVYGENLLVDGGVISNYPVFLFDSSKHPTIGFKLYSDQETMAPNPPNKIWSYSLSVVSTMLDAKDKIQTREWGYERTIHISSGDISLLNFDLSEYHKKMLFQSGQNAVNEFLLSNTNYIDQICHGGTTNFADTEIGMQKNIHKALKRIKFDKVYGVENVVTINRFSKTITINQPDGKVVQIEEGINSSGEPVEYITRYIAGDSSIDFDYLNFKAQYEIGSESYEAFVESESSEHSLSHKIKIGIKGKPITNGERFKLKFSYAWPGSFGSKDDYAVLFPNNYDETIEDVTLIIQFAGEPLELSTYLDKETSLFPISYNTKKIIELDNYEYHSYEYVLKNVKHIVLVRWKS